MNTDGQKVLLLSDHRFSDPGGRAERFRTRAKHLEECGWQVELGYVSEPYVLRFPLEVIRLVRKARREKVDVVNSVNHPFHLHVIGFVVALLSGAQWLVEFRDPMVTHPDIKDDVLLPLRRFVEWLSVHFSDKVVWGDGIQIPDNYYEETYAIPEGKVTRLPFAGYNAEAFESASTRQYNTFTVTYAGSFYEGWIEPYEFLAGIEQYVTQYDPEPFTVQFYGDWSSEYQREVEERGLERYIEVHDFVPHDEIIPVLKGSDVLVYLSGTETWNEQNVPSKIMDYIGAKRPILSISPDEFRVSKLIEEHQFGIVSDPTDPEDIADALDALRRDERRFGSTEGDADDFTRRKKNKQLVSILNEMVGSENGHAN
ncbi:glycosyltransferase [Haloferax sp. DFSO60]|uniref:glycosyltransferase n=1 Tax=Haloferax sp. DFSO60 TaxID=3388652 RepID=UPI0039792F5A